MNVAIGTLILFLLVVPGISFRNGYFFGSLTKKLSKASAFDDFVWAIIPGVFIQLLAAYVQYKKHLFGYVVDFSALGQMLFGGSEAATQFGAIEKFLGHILLYNVVLIVIAGLFGVLLRLTVRAASLDLMFHTLRFNNEWFYILKGENTFFIEQQDDLPSIKNLRKRIAYYCRYPFRKNKPDTCFVHAVARIDDASYIYTGYIHSFYLAKDGQLETLVLKGARRRKFFDQEPTDEFGLQNHIIVLKQSEILNIAVSFLDVRNRFGLSGKAGKPAPAASLPSTPVVNQGNASAAVKAAAASTQTHVPAFSNPQLAQIQKVFDAQNKFISAAMAKAGIQITDMISTNILQANAESTNKMITEATTAADTTMQAALKEMEEATKKA